MVKIIRRKFIGRAPTYDIGLSQDHNFLLGQGLVAANCFNKSHSTAYAYVTYQTAYLKANYPVEYMTALLSASSGNKDKVRKYRENAERMGIPVLPPDINESDLDFKPVGEGIRFGLSAVQNLGENAINAILTAREEGPFSSLSDLCSRLDLRVVNRRALETLITCGGLDSLHDNRQAMLKGLDLMMDWAQLKAKEKASGQTNLFESLGDAEATFDEAPVLPKVADLTLEEKLRQEKELLGFYVSEHPLEKLRSTISPILSPISLTAIANHINKKVSAVAILTDMRKIFTKANNEPMAFIQLEDISGQVEGIVFPRTYQKVEQLLQLDSRVIVWGKVQQKDDRTQLIVDDLEPIEEVRMLMIRLSPSELHHTQSQQRLKQILSQQAGDKKTRGRVPVIVIVGKGGDRTFIRLGQDYWVEDDHQALLALRQGGFHVYRENLIPQAQAS